MHTTKSISRLLLVFCVLLFSTANAYAQSTPNLYLPSVVTMSKQVQSPDQAGELIADQYIVVLNDELVTSASVSAIASEIAAAYGGEVTYTYGDALNGFAMKFPADTGSSAADRLSQDDRIELVEQDSVVVIADNDTVNTTQSGATWGLDRIDQRNRPLNGTFVYIKTGAGVRAYIIDTGILTSHTQFGGRASSGYDAVDGSLPAADCNGHGTHVAGTVGGQTYGVAKGVQLIAVRVLNCNGSGSTSGVIAGINWVTNQKRGTPAIPAVANMSLGGSPSSALDTAVKNSISAGVTYAVAAGNANSNACNYSPARVTSAITVGATTSNDSRASFSNFGICLDLFAPGTGIQSAWISSNSATQSLSGTSMATPHVTGVVALYLQTNPTATPATVASTLRNNATTGVVTGPGNGSPNRLLFTSY